MKVLIGTHNVANSITSMASGFRALGHDVSTAAFSYNKYYNEQSFDIILPHVNVITNGQGLHFDMPEITRQCLREHDMFVFIGASSLCHHLQELPVLWQLNKKVVIYCMGSEVRHKSVAAPFWNIYGYEFPDAHYPAPDEDLIEAHPALLDMYVNTFANKVYNVRMAERYATAIFSDIPTSLLGVRPVYAAPFPFSHELCKFHISGREIPHIVHAPTARSVKKTDVMLAALDTLRDRGVPFTFELIENRTNTEVLQALTQADILLDQIGSPGGHGRLSLEGLASGCVVVGCNNACVPYPPRCPIIRGNAATLVEQLHTLCTNRDLRIHLAAQGRAWMAQGQTAPVTIAQRMLDACDAALSPEYYPTAFVDLCTAPENEPLPEFLQEMTLEVLQKYGVHPEGDVSRLVEQGLLPKNCEAAVEALPRWNLDAMHKVAPFAWCDRHIAPHTNTNSLEYHVQSLS